MASGSPSVKKTNRRSLQLDKVLDNISDGVAVLNTDTQILWSNRQFLQLARREDVTNLGFYAALGHPEILGPEFCPFNITLTMNEPCLSTLRTADNHYLDVSVSPVADEANEGEQVLVVTVREVTERVLQRQKMAAIHVAGIELSPMQPDEVGEYSFDDRVQLLKQNILHYTQDLLKFDVIEIRLLDEQTGELRPLLSFGLDDAAAKRPLWARPKNNGVTGFVASSGRSYLCEDTTRDPLYITGMQGAKSSMTVPLKLQTQVIGTFNVESPKRRAFTENDLQFLEIFSRDVAAALNTLELLKRQEFNSTTQSINAMHRAVALPVDQLLNEAVNILEQFPNEPLEELFPRLQRILQLGRDLKAEIQRVGKSMRPTEAVPVSADEMKRPKLSGKRILVVDQCEKIRNDAHMILERYGCVVETACDGMGAIGMVRRCGKYDAIISDINLPDMKANELMKRLELLVKPLPFLLLIGFGWDPGHVLVRCTERGLHPRAKLFKPFKLEQLLTNLESIIDWVDAGAPPIDPQSL